MKKLLLTLVAAMIAFCSFAEDLPLVTSMEELTALPKETRVEFKDLRMVIETEVQDWGWMTYEIKTFFMPDSVTPIEWARLDGSGIIEFTVVGKLTTGSQGDDAFVVDSVVSIAEIDKVLDMLTFAMNEDNNPIFERSSNMIVGGEAQITALCDGYAFMNVAGAGPGASFNFVVKDNCEWGMWFGSVGDKVTGFKGKFVPEVRGEGGALVKGAYFDMASDVSYMNQTAWGLPVNYVTIDYVEADYYVSMAMRFAPGTKVIEKDGAYYAQLALPAEEGEEVEYQDVRLYSEAVDLEQLKDSVIEGYLAGVLDVCVVNDYTSLIVTSIIETPTKCNSISDYINQANLTEMEIPYLINAPVLVTAKYESSWANYLVVQDEYAAMVLNYSDMPDAIAAIKPGDSITGVCGLAEFMQNGAVPAMNCVGYDMNTYEEILFQELTVVDSGNVISPMRTVTVGDLVKEANTAYENMGNANYRCAISPKTVRLLDVAIFYNEDSTECYMAQAGDTLELSAKIWKEVETCDRNVVVGIADYMLLNSNYIYQVYPIEVSDYEGLPVVNTPDSLPNYEGELVQFVGMEVVKVAGEYAWQTTYCLTDLETLVDGISYETRMNVIGMYENGTFTVMEIQEVLGFASIAGMESYVSANKDAAETAFNIYGSMTVTYAEGNNVFVQYPDNYGSMEGTVLMGLDGVYAIGDSLSNVKGIYTPMDITHGMEFVVNRGSYFTVTDEENITVGGKGQVNYGDAIVFPYLESSANVYAGAAVLVMCEGGEVVKENDQFYYCEITYKWNFETSAEDTVLMKYQIASRNIDLEYYVGQEELEVYWQGVWNYKNLNDSVKVLYIDTEYDPYVYFENIAELMASEEMNRNQIALLKNPVAVTHTSTVSSVAIFIEDTTDAVCLILQDYEIPEGIEAGVTLVNVKGEFNREEGRAPRLFGYGKKEDYPLEVSDDTAALVIEPELVTLADLFIAQAESPFSYVSHLVTVEKVVLAEGPDEYGDTIPCLVQGVDTMFVPRSFADDYEVEEGVEYNITGIVDYALASYMEMYTIAPIEVIESAIAGVQNVERNARIFVANGIVFAEEAVEVAVYDINGRLVAGAKADNVNVQGLVGGVYIVRAVYADETTAVVKVVR